ncbi:phage baseplate protein [Lelliottia wanjuensis]|uniref:Dit-like phage tail protein N-terminal domain-containing protein n=1 Tax=Lelliottia wanjuensis TaxID=3050585 RepID=A0AAP4FZ86_9ENTR|nr:MULTISPECIES: hypothetical protein [unclassified Lelliottia]MDK9366444.1 hypothetical protein [Lelliottia sp. V106_12]MDK9618687.1 hypothetical protein [Lelliottia sp. V106_9]
MEDTKKHFNYGLAPSMILWEKDSIIVSDKQDSSSLKGLSSLLPDPDDYSDEYKNYNIYRFDAVVSEEHTDQSSITKFPMSNGFIVSDHTIKQNRQLKLKVVTANMVNSTLWEASIPGAILAAGDVVGMPIIGLIGNAAALVQTSFESDNRVQYAYKLLNSFLSNGTRLYVNTILGAYSNCVVTGITTMQDKDTSSILSAEIYLEELQVVDESKESKEIRVKLEAETDYSKFIKLGSSVGLFELNKVIGK